METGSMIALWIVVIIAAIVLEAMTASLVSIWFAAGALVAAILAAFDIPFYMQFIVFVCVSAAAMALIWPLKDRLLPKKQERTNADRIIGEEAIITLDVDNEKGQGLVNVHGQIWTARSADNEKISVGTRVKVEAIEGVKAIVKTLEKE